MRTKTNALKTAGFLALATAMPLIGCTEEIPEREGDLLSYSQRDDGAYSFEGEVIGAFYCSGYLDGQTLGFASELGEVVWEIDELGGSLFWGNHLDDNAIARAAADDGKNDLVGAMLCARAVRLDNPELKGNQLLTRAMTELGQLAAGLAADIEAYDHNFGRCDGQTMLLAECGACCFEEGINCTDDNADWLGDCQAGCPGGIFGAICSRLCIEGAGLNQFGCGLATEACLASCVVAPAIGGIKGVLVK